MEGNAGRNLFERLHPGFFDRPYIRAMEKKQIYEEMILGLGSFSCGQKEIPVPEGITFGFFNNGNPDALHESVKQVDQGWVQYFDKLDNVFCAFDGECVVSFCLLDDMGVHEIEGRKAKIAGPGCVGTVPDYRRKGIGLRMVQLATQILKDRGYEYSYIHYTGVGPWYAKLGYETLVRWNKDGIIE